jgi:hypothetical protein
MAKVKAPLMSFGASGSIAKSLVFFGWKGLDVVRSYTVPANPKSTGQITQRSYLSQAVGIIHAAQASSTDPLGANDVKAYALLASTENTPRTWFNQFVKQYVDQNNAGNSGLIITAGTSTPDDGALDVEVSMYNNIGIPTAGLFRWGTSKTALINIVTATIAGASATATIEGLANGAKYFWQFMPITPSQFQGVKSGIYSGVPSA